MEIFWEILPWLLVISFEAVVHRWVIVEGRWVGRPDEPEPVDTTDRTAEMLWKLRIHTEIVRTTAKTGKQAAAMLEEWLDDWEEEPDE